MLLVSFLLFSNNSPARHAFCCNLWVTERRGAQEVYKLHQAVPTSAAVLPTLSQPLPLPAQLPLVPVQF